MNKPAYITVGDIRRITGQPQHRVTYAIDRNGIEPVDRIGIARVWSADQLPLIQEALLQTEQSRIKRTGGKSQ